MLSPWYYVDGIMKYLVAGKKAGEQSWRDFFDVIVVNASKPGPIPSSCDQVISYCFFLDFFIKGKPFRELNPEDGSMMLAKVDTLERGKALPRFFILLHVIVSNFLVIDLQLWKSARFSKNVCDWRGK
jgi:hypothetical protein